MPLLAAVEKYESNPRHDRNHEGTEDDCGGPIEVLSQAVGGSRTRSQGRTGVLAIAMDATDSPSDGEPQRNRHGDEDGAPPRHNRNRRRSRPVSRPIRCAVPTRSRSGPLPGMAPLIRAACRVLGGARALSDATNHQNVSVNFTVPNPRLEAGDIALQLFRREDAGAVAAACEDEDILRFTFMQAGLTEARALEWINTANEWWHRGYPRFAVVDASGDRLLGQVGLGINDRQLSAEGYYWVDRSERRRGVASRALGLVADWGFSNGIERLFLLIHPENQASNRLAARMGFTREGVLRSYEPIKGRRPDLVSWSLLPKDPRAWRS